MALLALYARGGAAWALGFVALVPWLCSLSAQRSFAATLGSATLMAVAYTAAAFAWFGTAIGSSLPRKSSLPVVLIITLLLGVGAKGH